MNKSGSRVSVVMPAYNAANFIAESVESALDQTYDNVEIIIVDDGSVDETAKIVQSFGSKVQYIRQDNSGCGAARNTGLKACSGDFITFLDSDDLYMPDRIAKQVAFMSRHRDVDLVFSDYRNFDEEGDYTKSHFETCPRLQQELNGRPAIMLENARKFLLLENFGIASSFMIRRRVFHHVSEFDTFLQGCADFHFYFRVARHTAAGVINEVGLRRRMHSHNMSGNSRVMLEEGIRCRSLLAEEEEDLQVVAGLKRYICRCKGALARLHANQREIGKAYAQDLQVLFGPFFSSEACRSCKGILRTTAIALGLFEPRDQHRQAEGKR